MYISLASLIFEVRFLLFLGHTLILVPYLVQVDVYSFGVLLCEMCIRELPDPLRRDRQVVMVKNKLNRALIRKCLQLEPEARPSIQEIIDELEEPV